PSEVLNDDEIEAFEALKAAEGRNGIRSVHMTVEPKAGRVHLSFSRRLTARDTPLLQRISKLGMVSFNHPETLSDDDLHFLEGVGMKALVIRNQSVTNEGLKTLKRFPQLEYVNFQKQLEITDSGLAILRELPHLKRIFVSDIEITDAGLKHIGEVKRLEKLE